MRVSRYLLGTARELSSFDDINTVVEEQIQRRASLPPQLVRATSSEGSSGSMLSHGTVPTEVLSSTHSHEGLTLPEEAPPVGCFLRLLTQRPRLVISAIYLFTVLIMTLMWAFGDIQLVLDEDAFKDTKNIEVARHATAEGLLMNTAYMRAKEYGWRASSGKESVQADAYLGLSYAPADVLIGRDGDGDGDVAGGDAGSGGGDWWGPGWRRACSLTAPRCWSGR